MENFRDILHDNEKIIDVVPASRKGFVWKRVYPALIVFFVITLIFTLVAIFCPYRVVDKGFFGEEARGMKSWVVFAVSGPLLFIVIVTLILSIIESRKYFICLTNNRLIIKKGIFATNYIYYAIDKVSGNITINCNQSIFDNKKESACALMITIELLPAGHGKLVIYTSSLKNGFEFSKKVDKQIKNNSMI